MSGFVIDIFIGFMVRWLVICWRNFASRSWPTVSGTIVRCYFEKCGYGGSYVVLQYKYKANFERYRGEIRRPYIYPNYADAFVRHHSEDTEVEIHVDPKDPTRSFPILGQ
jgi:hypothetical protein